MGHQRGSELGSFFEPKSIAVAGASADPEKLGSIIFSNLLANRRRGTLKARVFALNPSYESIGDEPCYPTIGALPGVPELLVVAVPARQTLGLVRSAGTAGVKAVILIAGGYAEVGNEREEREIREVARRSGMRVLGPNTIGLVDTVSGVDTLFLRPTKTLPDGGEIVSAVKARPGRIAVITQSGFIGEAVSEELAARGAGVRAIVGTGNQLDVSVEDVVRHFEDDPSTDVMAVYLEGVKDGRGFMRAAASASRRKPMVVFKAGKTEKGARAALTHTATMVGNYEVYGAAFRQSGVVEASTFQELVDYSIALQTLPRKQVRRLAVLTNAGGVGAIAADEAVKAGMKVEPMGPPSERRVRAEFRGSGFMANSSLGNPIDLTASVSSDEFAALTELVLSLPDYDGAVVLPTHQAPGMRYDVGERFGRAASKSGKPVSVCVMGEDEMADRVRRELMALGAPSYPTPERAVRAVASVSRYATLLRGTRSPPKDRPRRARRSPGPSLDQLLESYGIAQPRSVVIRSPAEAASTGLGFPVACKLISKELSHKSDAGGVILGVEDSRGVRSAYGRLSRIARRRGLRLEGMMVQEMVGAGVELLLGETRDAVFGPVVTLGLGGKNAELMQEYVLAVAPVTATEVKRLIVGTKIMALLEGYRGGPAVSVEKLCRAVSRFSRALVDSDLAEVEVNPLVATARGLYAVDVRGR